MLKLLRNSPTNFFQKKKFIKKKYLQIFFWNNLFSEQKNPEKFSKDFLITGKFYFIPKTANLFGKRWKILQKNYFRFSFFQEILLLSKIIFPMSFVLRWMISLRSLWKKITFVAFSLFGFLFFVINLKIMFEFPKQLTFKESKMRFSKKK